MKLTSQRTGNANLLLTINLVAFVVLLNVLLLLLQSDTGKLSANLSALSSEVSSENTGAVLPKGKAGISSLEGLYFFTTTVILPIQPATFVNCLLIR